MSFVPQAGDRVIKCDCCGKQTVAIVRGETILIVRREHGQYHRGTVRVRELFDPTTTSGQMT